MEPFPVFCETCHARLKVRSESVIGQIHGCPKCGSMVHIVPPRGWKPGTAAAMVAASGKPSTEAPLASSLDNAADTFAAAAAEASPPTAEATLSPVASTIAAPSIAIAPAAAWWPVILWGAIGAAVLLVGGAIVVATWPTAETAAIDAAPPAAAARPTIAVSEPGDPPAANRTKPLVDETEVADVEVADEPPASTVATPVDDSAVAAAAEPQISDAPSAGDRAADVADEPAAPTGVSAAPSEQPNNAVERRPVLRFDPLDFDPSQLSLGTSAFASTHSTSASIPEDAPGEAAGDEVASASGNLDSGLHIGETMPPPAAVNRPMSVRVGPATTEATEPHNVAHQLGLELASLEITDMPLARFVDALSDLAGVPITLDPAALELAGAAPQAKVSIKARDIAVEKLLRNALAAHRLGFLEHGGQVVVALADGDRRSARDYQLQDLVAPGQPDAAALARMIETFVAPRTWQTAGGDGTLHVEGTKLRVDQAKRVHHELLVFCERLRLARGLPLKSRYPAERLSVESPYAKLGAKLDARTTFTFLPWTRLADVVRWWQEAAGVTILVDWRALADVQLGPSTPIACSANDRPWGAALVAILEPLNLGWYAVDGETIAITSRDALEHLEHVEFYAISKALREQFASCEALVESLRRELQELTEIQPAGTDDTRIEEDASCSRLIVRGREFVHRYLRGRLDRNAE